MIADTVVAWKHVLFFTEKKKKKKNYTGYNEVIVSEFAVRSFLFATIDFL